jgi:PEP-CTERM motif
MRKSSWIVLVLLLSGAIAAPRAHADDIVQVTISDLTFNGNNDCGPPVGTRCTQTLSAAFQWDNTTDAYVGGSLTFGTSGLLGTTLTLTQGPRSVVYLNATREIVTDFSTTIPASLELVIGEASPPLPTGAYQLINDFSSFKGDDATFLANLYCGSDDSSTACLAFATPVSNTLVADAGALTVSAVPEPNAISLMLIGVGSLGLVMALRKRTAQGLPQAT